MRDFCDLFWRLDELTSTKKKVQVLAEYFRSRDDADLAWSVYLLTGRRAGGLLTSSRLREIFLSRSKTPEWLYSECYSHVGDTAETITLLLGTTQILGTTQTVEPSQALETNAVLPSTSILSRLPSLSEFFEQDLTLPLQADVTSIDDFVWKWWLRLNKQEVFVFCKLLTGGLRVGVSEGLVAKALSQAFAISEEEVHLRLSGKWSPESSFGASLRSSGSSSGHSSGGSSGQISSPLNNPSLPYPFFLASPLATKGANRELGSVTEWWGEWKWDGIRGQLVWRKAKAYLWSRGGELITDRFPEISSAVNHWPSDVVLDGEILAWGEAGPLSFQALQTRVNRKNPSPQLLKKVPACFVLFDLLEWEGKDLREKPLEERRNRLEHLLNLSSSPYLKLSPLLPIPSWSDLDKLRAEARAHCAEGIMIKKKSSSYGVGRKRGAWWKHKVDPLSVDAVLIYAQAGSGRRSNLFTDYTFALWDEEGKLVPVAKAYSGLDQKEIDELDRWIRSHVKEKFGPVRSVEPLQVFEIAFEGISKSSRHKSGLAVRFPRIRRWRRDKSAAEADRLDVLKSLL